MTLQQKRRALAEACPGIFGITHSGFVFWPDTQKPITEREWLYACWLAEETLDPHFIDEYSNALLGVLIHHWTEERWHKFSDSGKWYAIATATESQRLDAWLKVKGLWREG